MSGFLCNCLGQKEEQMMEPTSDKFQTILPEPIKFKIAKGLNLFDLLIKHFAEPRKRQQYTFPRNNLRFLTGDNSHLPILYFPSAFPSLSLIMVYCHGSGSTLNNVFDFAYTMSIKYGVAFLAYDYTGDGESQKEFVSFEDDIKTILAWIVRQGYKLNRTVISGFSLGSYSALCIQGEMPRLLISPVCGIISFLQTEAARYQGQKYDNISKALKLNTKVLITHCSDELVHISHGQLLFEALKKKASNKNNIIFYQITDKLFSHRSAPSFLCSTQGQDLVRAFLSQISTSAKKNEIKDVKTRFLLKQLQTLKVVEFSESTEQTKLDAATSF